MAEAIYIYDAVRTPRGRGKSSGSLHKARPVELTKTVLDAIRERNSLDTAQVDDLILGCVTPVGEQGADFAKLSALYAGYADSVAGVQVNRFCASGLEAVNQAGCSVAAGYTDLVIAGGVESMSRVPMGMDGGAWMIDPDVSHKIAFVPQGISADLMATLDGVTREQADQFAIESQTKAAKAWQEKRFARAVIPVKDEFGDLLLDHDEHIRADTTLSGLATLKPSFAEMGEKFGFDAFTARKYPQVESVRHIHHAGNSSGIVDGAAAVLIGNEKVGKRNGWSPRARIRGMALTSTEPVLMLGGPGPASQKVLEKCGLRASEIDLWEINEAFAAVVLRAIRELEIDPKLVNVNGGSIAMGHPLGATGAMLLATIVDELERQQKKLGLVTLCIGGGMGIATIVERV